MFKGFFVRVERFVSNHSRYFELKELLFECIECAKDM